MGLLWGRHTSWFRSRMPEVMACRNGDVFVLTSLRDKTDCMLRLMRLLFVLLVRSVRSRRDLLLENLALRQQLAVLKARRPQPRFASSDKLFWVMLRRLRSGWKRVLVLVQPETVVSWHRSGFKSYWAWLSWHRNRAGRKFARPCDRAQLVNLFA